MFSVGAALHELDPLYKEFTYSSKVSSLILSLGYRRPVIMQSMYIFKVLLVFWLFLFSMFYDFRSTEINFHVLTQYVNSVFFYPLI